MIEKIKEKSLEWWNDLPVQNIRDDRNGWANLVMIYYPNRGSCYGLTDKQIMYMYIQEHKIELRRMKINKICQKITNL